MEWAELLSGLLFVVLFYGALATLVFAVIGINTVYSNYKDSKWEKEHGSKWAKLEDENKRNEWEDMERLKDKIFLLEETVKACGLEKISDEIDVIMSNENYDALYDDYRKNETKYNIIALSSMAGGFGSSEKAQADVLKDLKNTR